MTTSGLNKTKIFTIDELRLFLKYWLIVLTAAVTYALFLGISKL